MGKNLRHRTPQSWVFFFNYRQLGYEQLPAPNNAYLKTSSPFLALPTDTKQICRELQIPALCRSTTITHRWDCYSSTQLGSSKTHSAFYSAGSKIMSQVTCFLHCLEKNILNTSGSHLLPMQGMARAPSGSVQICTLFGELKAKQQPAMPCQPYPAQTTKESSECNWVYLFSPPCQSNVQTR